MNLSLFRNTLSDKYVAAALIVLPFACPALCASKSSPAPAKAASSSKSSGSSGKSSSGANAGHSGPTTAGHGPSTAGHGPTTSPTTASHGPATAGGRVPASATSGARGTAAPNGHSTAQTRNGGTVTKRADGRVASMHDPKRGMDVHNSLNGNRRAVSERGDHSRTVSERGGRGYVQRPYRHNGHEYGRRSYYRNGRYYHGYYGRYYYHGLYMDPYYPSYYYGAAYYGWVYNPWVAPVSYAWGFGGNPWYGYYGGYFAPSPVYANASLWLTDYMIANSLESAYQAQGNAPAAALSNPAPLTPYVKNLIAEDVKQQIALENTEAKAAGQNVEPDAASSSIQRLLTDGRPHVFIAGNDLDVTDGAGNECALSEGDALQLRTPPTPDAQAANLAVLASKGGRECPRGDTVSVALQDLQDMQNHMRESIDQGMQELQKKQGQGGLPAAPASARVAPVESPIAVGAPPPPPESEVVAEITHQSQEADRAEQEASAGLVAGPGPSAPAPPAEPVSIGLGLTVDQVTAALGTPLRIVNLAAKQIYVYKDMKITFNDGKVTDIQ